MVLQIIVSPINFNINLESRDALYDTIKEYIKDYLKDYNSCERTIITLPSSLTKAERYSIHKFTKPRFFEPVSHDDGHGNRIMEITLSKSMVEQLFEDYQFEGPIPEVNLKQQLFNEMITFIETNLSEQFKFYLDQI
jgi:hypothetical protein